MRHEAYSDRVSRVCAVSGRGAVFAFLCACVRRGNGHASGALIRQAEEEQYTAAAESLRQAKQLWEGRETVLGIFLHHEEVDEILALFAQLEAFIKLEDLDDYLAACGELTARLEHVRRMELPTVENVM